MQQSDAKEEAMPVMVDLTSTDEVKTVSEWSNRKTRKDVKPVYWNTWPNTPVTKQSCQHERPLTIGPKRAGAMPCGAGPAGRQRGTRPGRDGRLGVMVRYAMPHSKSTAKEWRGSR